MRKILVLLLVVGLLVGAVAIIEEIRHEYTPGEVDFTDDHWSQEPGETDPCGGGESGGSGGVPG